MNKLKIIWEYIKQILQHKKYVFQECKKCGIIWQGITHDLSKFSKEELIPSAKYYDYNNVERTDKIIKDYSKAWCYHKGHNKHHWEYWTDFSSSGEVISYKIPYKYVVEMVCDWIGAGKAYEKREWNQSNPLKYYNKVRQGRYFHPETEELILKFLYCIKDEGLDEFHRIAKLHSFMELDYERVWYE